MAASSFQSVPEIFLHRVSSTPDSDAYYSPENGGWRAMSWRECGDRVRAIACGLRALGLESEERCAILSSTRLEWVLSDLGVLCAGGATTTIYPSNTAEECTYILTDSDTRYVFAEDAAQLAKLRGERERLPGLRKVIVLDGKGSDDGWAIGLAELEAKGRAWDKEHRDTYEQIASAVRPDQLATLIYTSGTTGRPKGVELTHDCWVFESEAMDSMGILSPADKQYLWLPLAHSFGKVLEVGSIRIGMATAIDGRIDKLVDNLAVVQPTIIAAVPRIFEKVYNKVVTGAKEGGALKYRIFTWSLGVGRQVSKLRQSGREPSGLLAIKYKLADKLVFSKLKARFGGRVRFFLSGSAPLSREIAEFFHAADILILEGYGLTESSAASFVNRPEKYKFGTVGLPVPGVSVRLDPADGEILMSGRGIMRGYHKLDEATAEALTEDGWLRTGDIGTIDEAGFLHITDRKKDLIKTSGGKYVAPQELEGQLKLLSPLISQVVVHGNNRNFCAALVTVDEEAVRKWATDNGVPGTSASDLARSPQLQAVIGDAVQQLNATLPSYSTLKRFAVLDRDFSIEGGELTPSQKVKRKVVEQRYKDILDGFYEGSVASV